jgi:23S rRNA (pseudouridine1915-N3)-methyltransferase
LEKEAAMRVSVLAIGRLKAGPETELCERYRKRATQAGRQLGFRDIELVEIRESRADSAEKRQLEEAIALANVIPEGAVVVLLSETGDNLGSAGLTEKIRLWRDEGRPALVFIIGGPDGLAKTLQDKARMTLSFGAATWPHQLVRSMLFEQIYRAVTILGGHPYHRA